MAGMNAARSVPVHSPDQRRLTFLAILLGALAAGGSLVVCYSAYDASRRAIVEQMLQSNMDLARLLGSLVDTAPSHAEQEVVSQLKQAWQHPHNEFPHSYLCLVNQRGELELNTGNPSLVHTSVGHLTVIEPGAGTRSSLSEMVKSGKSGSGWYTSLSGETQIASFAFLPNRVGLLAVHVPQQDVDRVLRRELLPWIIGMCCVGLLLAPLSLILQHRAYSVLTRDRTRIMTALRNAEEKWKALVTSAPNLIATVMPDGALDYANRELPRSAQAGDAEPSIYELFAPEQEPMLRENLSRVFQHGEDVEFELPAKPDFSDAWYTFRVGPILDGDQVVAATLVATDISQRRRTEVALRQSEELNRRIIEVIPGGVVQVSQQGEIQHANQEAERVLGLSYDELLGVFVNEWGGETIFENGEPCPVEEFPVARCLATGQPQDSVILGTRRPDGSLTWAVYTAVPLISLAESKTEGAIVAFIDITARKIMEDALRRGEERYRTLVQNAPLGIVDMDAQGDIVSVNLAGRQMFTALDSERPVVGLRFTEVFDAADAELENRLAEAQQGEPVDFEFSTNSGAQRQVFSVSLIPIRDDAGALRRLMAILQDITRRRHAEDSLRRSESMQRAMLQGIPDLVVRLDRDGNVPQDGVPDQDTLIHQPQAFQGYRIADLVPSQMQEDRRKAIQQALATRQAVTLASELEVGGAPRYFESRVSANREDDAVLVVRDISERRRAEAELDRFFEISVDLLCTCSFDGRFQRINPAFGRTLGYTDEEMVTQPFINLVHPEDRDATLAELGNLEFGNPTVGFQNRYFKKDGTFCWLEWNCIPIPEVGLIYATARDITPRRTAEEETRQHQIKLAHVARLATMGEMVGGIAHEINQPLYAILNFTTATINTLNGDAESKVDKAGEWCEKIAEQANRAGEIIRRLRDFTRAAEFDRQPLDINEVVRDSIELVAVEARRHKVEVVTRLQNPGPQVLADRIQVEQTLVNLLRNAYEAIADAERRQRKVTVTTRRTDDAVTIAVHDSGPGVESADRERLFDTFHTTKPEGMGMGLSISRNIVEAHGGRLWLEETSSHGSTFCFTLPASEQVPAA